MENVVADFDENQVTSCLELAAMRQEEERLAVQAVDERVTQMVREALVRENSLDRVRLRERRDMEMNTKNELEAMTVTETQVVTEMAAELNDLHYQLTKVRYQTQTWQERLDQVQLTNSRLLETDPIYLMMLEEQQLTAQLEALTKQLENGSNEAKDENMEELQDQEVVVDGQFDESL